MKDIIWKTGKPKPLIKLSKKDSKRMVKLSKKIKSQVYLVPFDDEN